MRRVLALLGLGLIILPLPAYAVDSNYIPAYVNKEPILLPDSPLYFVKTVYETFRYALAFTAKSKVNIGMLLAERRLREAEKVTEVGNEDQAAKLLSDYQNRLENIQRIANTAGRVGGEAVEFSMQAQESLKRQKATLNSMGFKFDTVTELEDSMDRKVTTVSATIQHPYRLPAGKSATPAAKGTASNFFGTILNWLLGKNTFVSPTVPNEP